MYEDVTSACIIVDHIVVQFDSGWGEMDWHK